MMKKVIVKILYEDINILTKIWIFVVLNPVQNIKQNRLFLFPLSSQDNAATGTFSWDTL